MPEPQKRQIAYKVRIKDILNGRYIKEEGWQPNYIITEDEREISRINLISVVVAKDIEFNYETGIIDDGSGKISVRSFSDNKILNDVNVGDVILIIGRPREYNNEKYIMPEIIKKVKNEKWIELRRIELERLNKKEVKKEKIEKEEPIETLPSDKIHNLIKELDSGEGVEVDEVINKSGINDAEKIINSLLTEGEIFQNKPGRLKILE